MPKTPRHLTDASLTKEPPSQLVHDLYPPYDGPPTRYEWHLHNSQTNEVTIFQNPGDAKASIPLNTDHLTWEGSPLVSYHCYLVGEPDLDLNHSDPWDLQIDLNNPPDHLLIYTLTRHPVT